MWYGWLFLLAVLIIPAVICGVLYSGKSGSIRTGECVLVKGRKKAAPEKREKEQKPS